MVVDRVPEIARALDHARERVRARGRAAPGEHQLDLVRPDRDDQRRPRGRAGRREPQPQCPSRRDTRLGDPAVDQVGPADELGDEACARAPEEILGAPDLHDPAAMQNRDAIGDDHGFRLVVGDVEGRDAEGLVQPTDLETHFLA